MKLRTTLPSGHTITALFALLFLLAGLPFAKTVSAQNSQLMHYWNFNNPASQAAQLTSSFSINTTSPVIQAAIVAPSEIQLTSNTGQDFAGANARLGDPAGTHLRFNNPIGSTLTIPLPTTGYEDVQFRFETRRSGSGANTQLISYTVDGTNFVPAPLSVLTVTEVPTVYRIDFSSIPTTDNNANFAVRFAFDDTTDPKNMAGNNRFDNMTLDGLPQQGTNAPPSVVRELDDLTLIAGGGDHRTDLRTIFQDPENDPLTFTVSADRGGNVIAEVVGNELIIRPNGAGGAVFTVSANDGRNPVVSTTMYALAYPGAYLLADADFAFNSWGELEPEGAFPPHMLFLQSAMNDPRLDDALMFAYHVPESDYAESDLVSLGFPYRLESRTRIRALGNDGIAFINTGRGRDLGGALIALDTRGVARIRMNFLAGTVLPNFRIYRIRAQYRVGFEGAWVDVLDAQGNPVEYTRNEVAGHTQPFSDIALPSAVMEMPYVQLLFRYYYDNAVSSGARAMLRVDDITLNRVLTTSVEPTWGGPIETSLRQNWPNPFNPETSIQFTMGVPGNARLAVYDLLGREIAVLADGFRRMGSHTVNFDAASLASGVYVYRLDANGEVLLRRMTLMK